MLKPNPKSDLLVTFRHSRNDFYKAKEALFRASSLNISEEIKKELEDKANETFLAYKEVYFDLQQNMKKYERKNIC